MFSLTTSCTNTGLSRRLARVAYGLLLTLLLTATAQAQTTLSPGDIAVVGFNSDRNNVNRAEPDELVIVATVPIAANTRIYITDFFWDATNSRFGNDGNNGTTNPFTEGRITWTTTAPIVAGTVFKINIVTTGGLGEPGTASVSGLPGTATVTGWQEGITEQGGDNWMLYQGTSPNTPANWVYAWGNWSVPNTPAYTWLTSNATITAIASMLPAGLTNGTTASALVGSTVLTPTPRNPHYDNIVYTGTRSGTRAQVLQAIGTPANWLGDELTPYNLSVGGTYFPGSNPIFTIAPATAPTVTTTAPASITTTGATLGGNVTADGGATVTERGVVYIAGTSAPTTTTGTKLTSGTGTGSFTVNATSLTAGTQYTARAYAINSAGTSYGTNQTFTTTAAAPTLTSLSPTSGAAGSSVILTGTGIEFANVFFGSSQATVTSRSSTQLTVNVPNGIPTGNYAVFVQTPVGSSSTLPFRVISVPNVFTLDATGITKTSATLSGNVTDDGGVPVTERGVVYVRGGGTPTILDGTKLTSTGTTGIFTVNATDLLANTYYTLRAYAINSEGINYGGSRNFTTSSSTTITGISPTSGPAGTVVTLTGTDFTGATTVSFSLYPVGASNGAFTVIDATTIRATVPAIPAYPNANGTYKVTVRTPNGTSNEQNFGLTTPPANQAPVIAAQTRSVAENSPSGTPVGLPLTASDVDAGQTLTYAITASSAGPIFTINPSTGQLAVAPDILLNYEQFRSFTLTVRVTDNGSPALSSSATITVNVTDVNEAPFYPSTIIGINENTPLGTVVSGSTTGTDPEGAPLTYVITGGNTGGAFAINPGTGAITVAGPLDFEGPTTTYVLGIQVSDGILTGTGQITFIVSNVNEAPTALALNNTTVAENSGPNAVVGTLLAADVDPNLTDKDRRSGDLALEGITYSLVSGAGSTDNALVNISGDVLRITANPDFETKASYAVRVRATDAGGLFFDQPFVITVTDVNETLADLTVSTATGIAAGAYNNVTVTGTGVATLSGAVTVTGALTVQTGGTLNTNCQSLTGSGSFTLQAGATLGICDAAGITATGSTGAVQLSGTRSFSQEANYVYNGTVAQSTGAGLPAQVLNLTSTNNALVTLSRPVAIRQVLTLNNGNLATNGQPLTLLSDATGTALIANLGTGAVVGDVTVQRYLDGSLNAGLGYRHLVAPVLGATVSTFGSGGTTPLVNSAYNTAANPGAVAPFPTVYFYDQARLATSPATTLSAFDKGWQSPDALSDAAPLAGRGFTVQLPGASTLSFTGPVAGIGGTTTLDRASGATAAEAGWNLIGNPYPSPLDLSTVTAGQRQNMDAAFYTYESTSQYEGQYRSFINGFGNPLIGSSQAFFVRVSAGQTSGGLELSNANRVTSYGQQAPVRRGTADSRPQLQLTLAGNGLSDALTLYAQAPATAGFDKEFDAAKLWNPNGLNVATVAASGEALAIDGRPAFPLAQPVALTLQAPQAGTYSLTATSLANLAAGTTMTLVDLQTGTRTPLLAGTSYSVQLPAGTTAGRLQLEVGGRALSTAGQLAQQLSLYPNPTQGQVQLVRPAAWGAVQVQVLNSVGQLVQATRLSVGEQTLDVQALPMGVYTLRLTTQAGQTLTKRLVRQ